MHLACWFLFHGSYSLDFWALGLMQCFGVSFFKGGDGGVAPVAYENLGIFEFFFFFGKCANRELHIKTSKHLVGVDVWVI